MSFAKSTNYRGYQVNTLVQPSYRPNVGFVGYVSVEVDGTKPITNNAAVMSHFIFAETAARDMGHEIVDTILALPHP